MPRFLTYKQAARRVGRSIETVKRWRRDGLPMVNRDGYAVVSEDELLAWFRARLLADPVHQIRMRRVRREEDRQESARAEGARFSAL